MGTGMRRPSHYAFKFMVSFVFLLIFCEFILYYVVISQCSWPSLEQDHVDESIYVQPEHSEPVRAMFVADLHLLGSVKGHWFDKLRREWQMYRSFQAAITLFNPEVVFVLGDLFDEGLWCSDEEFHYYFERFNALFHVPESTDIYVVVGNHDIGFHYGISPYLSERFTTAFKSPSVQLISIRGNHFILLNSMAMEGDGCFLCRPAQIQLNQIANKLKCAKGIGKCSPKMNLNQYSRPILLQHFPMYRASDSVCSEPDQAPEDFKKQEFRERWNCLSRESSEMIYDNLRPRVIVTGHTHHGCHVIHRNDIHEFTIPSFNWRNKNNPSFMLGVFAPNNYETNSAILKKILTRVIQIQDLQMVHSRQLNYLTFGQDLFTESNNEFANKLPIKTLNDLEVFDADLKRDELLKLRLIEHLSRVGGNSVVDATRRIMKRLLTDDVAQLYSYRGLKKKMRFDQLALKGVIFDSVRRNPPSKEATDVEMEKILKEHLKHAKFRLQSKKLNPQGAQINMV